MRELWLEDENGVQWKFNDIRNSIATNLSNLGIEITNTYFEYDNSYARATKKMPMMKPTFNIVFFKGYQGYQDFIKFAYRAESLKLFYKSVDTKYCYVDLEQISKTELVANNALNCQIVFNRKSMWMKEFLIAISTEVTSEGKSYEYTYDYRYMDIAGDVISVTNNGSIPAPLSVEIIGTMNNPSIQIYVDDEIYSELSLNIVTDNPEAKLQITSDEGNEQMLLDEGEAKNVYQNQDFTKDSFLFLPVGSSKIIISPGTISGTHKFNLTFHELYGGN